MPIDTLPARSPGGDAYVCVVAHGEVSGAEARALVDAVSPGGAHQNAALLAVVREGAEITAEARRVLSMRLPERNARQAPIALVVESVAVRVIMCFLFRLSGAATRTDLFATEADARVWLFPLLAARRKRPRIERSVDDLELALKDNPELALGEICAHYASLRDPLVAGAFLLRVTEAMARLGLPWDFVNELMARRATLARR